MVQWNQAWSEKTQHLMIKVSRILAVFRPILKLFLLLCIVISFMSWNSWYYFTYTRLSFEFEALKISKVENKKGNTWVIDHMFHGALTLHSPIRNDLFQAPNRSNRLYKIRILWRIDAFDAVCNCNEYDIHWIINDSSINKHMLCHSCNLSHRKSNFLIHGGVHTLCAYNKHLKKKNKISYPNTMPIRLNRMRGICWKCMLLFFIFAKERKKENMYNRRIFHQALAKRMCKSHW